MHNVVFLEFFKKEHFPPGEWHKEPDLVRWINLGVNCLAIRDMSLGIWRGFVGVNQQHLFYKKSIENILATEKGMDFFFATGGRFCSVGRLPAKYREYVSNLWWVGITTNHADDYMPLIKLENPDMFVNQTYKNFSFIRSETNKMSKLIISI